MRELFSKVLEQSFNLEDQKLANPQSPFDLGEGFDLNLEEKGLGKDLSSIIDCVFKNSVNTQNPRFLNQLYGGSTQEAWLGELMVAILNTSMATYEIAPLFTLMEKEIFSALNKEIHFPKYEGLMVPGGSYANMLGLHCARYAFSEDIKKKGLYESAPFKVFVSEVAHYSTEKNLGLLGLGTEALVKVKVDENQRMSLEDLVTQIEKAKTQGYKPLCVVSTAGTTVWGSFDPIAEINKICKQQSIWHHVDAAWGGLALWSEKKGELFKDLEKVDSITLDFHKLMASTLTKGVFMTSRPQVLKLANAGGGTEYIFHNHEDENHFDTGMYSLQCGRKVNSLPVWLQWKARGTEGFRKKVTELYGFSENVIQFLEANADRYRLLLEPDYMNICFQVLPKDPKEDVGDFNKKLRETLMARGKFMVNFSRTNEKGYFFRLVLNHWGLKQEILDEFFVELESIAKELEESRSL